MKPIIRTSTLLLLSAMMTDALATCPSTGQVMGVATTLGNTTVTFKALTTPGQTVTVSGLTLTAPNPVGNYHSAVQIASAFASHLNGVQPGSPFGSTALSGWKSGTASNDKVTFVSVSPNKAALVVSSSATTTVPNITSVGAPVNNGVALSTLLVGNTVCVGSTGNWQAQEWHQGSSGLANNLIDFKHGAGSVNDPTAPVGSWAIDSTNNTVSYTYHGSTTPYVDTVYDNGNSTYTFCDASGNTTIASAIKPGQQGC